MLEKFVNYLKEDDRFIRFIISNPFLLCIFVFMAIFISIGLSVASTFLLVKDPFTPKPIIIDYKQL